MNEPVGVPSGLRIIDLTRVLAGPRAGLVYAAVSGYGGSGPYRLRPGYDIIAQAMDGLMSTTGWPGDERTRRGAAKADLLAGPAVTIGVLAAHGHRDRSGAGQNNTVDQLILDPHIPVARALTSAWGSTTKAYVASCPV